MADNLFAVCEPRADVLQGTLKESDFAADLSHADTEGLVQRLTRPVSPAAQVLATIAERRP